MSKPRVPLYSSQPFIRQSSADLAVIFLHVGMMLLTRLIEAPLDWRDRARQRRQLQMMDDFMLRDIGLSRADIEQESQKPFWRS